MTSSKPASETAQNAEPTEAAPRPKITIKPAATTSQPSENPFKQLGVKGNGAAEPTSSPGSSRVVRKKRTASDIDDETPANNTAQPRKQTTQSPESDEDYVNRTLMQIFRMTVDPHHMTTPQGQRLAFLPNLNEELNDAKEPLKLSLATLGQAVIEAGGNWPQGKPLMDYLLPCWKRAVKAAASSKATSGPKAEVHEEAKRLCMSNALFALTMPDLYGCVPLCVGLSLGVHR
jgi:ubiquitin conjugation factor E4 B